MNANSANCSVCSGRIGILPTARSVTCPHCNAFQNVLRSGQEMKLSLANKYAENPEILANQERARENDQFDLEQKITRRHAEEYALNLPRTVQAVTLFFTGLLIGSTQLYLSGGRKGLLLLLVGTTAGAIRFYYTQLARNALHRYEDLKIKLLNQKR
ncbi:hypothetical protein [Lacunimicrobium album]